MDTILTQYLSSFDNLSTTVEEFLQKVELSELFDKFGVTKRSGTSSLTLIRDIIECRLNRSSIYMDFKVFNEHPYKIDTVYRFLKKPESDWFSIQTELSYKVYELICQAKGFDSNNPGVFTIDDTPFHRPDSLHTELIAKQFDHARFEDYLGFRVSGLSFFGNGVRVGVNFVPVSKSDEDKVINKSTSYEEGTVAARKREMSLSQLNEICMDQIDAAREAGFNGRYGVMDSWYTQPKTIIQFLERDIHVIGMVKARGATHYEVNGQSMTVSSIYNAYKHKVSESQNENILFSVLAKAHYGSKVFPVKLVFCRATGKKKEFVCILSTDYELSDDAIVSLYSIRWGDEVIFSEIKSPEVDFEHMNQCQTLDAIWAGIAITGILHLLLTYISLVVLNRTISESFYFLKEEISSVRALNIVISIVRPLITNLSMNHSIPMDSLIQETCTALEDSPDLLLLESRLFMLL